MEKVMKTQGKIGMDLEIQKLEFYNKIIRRLIIAIIVFLFVGVLRQEVYGQIKWEKIIGGDRNDYLVKVRKIENGYVILSNSSSDSSFDKSTKNSNNYDQTWIIRIDSLGNKIWDKSYTCLNSTFGYSSTKEIIQTSDKGFLILGEIYSNYSDLWLLKLDSNGNKQWDSTYKAKDFDQFPNSVIEKNGSYYVGLSSYSDTGLIKNALKKGYLDYWILKINKNGVKIWDKTYGGLNDQNCFSKIISTKNNEICLIGNTNSSQIGNSKTSNKLGLWIVKIDTNGNKIIDKTIGGLYIDSASIDAIYLNKYIYIGCTTWEDSTGDKKQKSFGQSDIWIICLDSNLNLIWEKTIGSNKRENQLSITSFTNNEIYLSCISNSDQNSIKSLSSYNNSNDNWLIIIDSLGNIIREQTIGGSGSEQKFIIHKWGKNKIHGFCYSNSDSSFNKKIINKAFIDLWIFELKEPTKKIQGSIFPDFNSNCLFNKPSEYNIKNTLIHNKVENTYAITNDSIYTMYLFDSDTAILKVINLDSNLYVSCGKDSLIINMAGKIDSNNNDFPIRSTKKGPCIKITSFSHSLMRPGLWGTYQLNYQNNAYDTAFNAYIDVEIDTAKIDSITSPYSFTRIGNILLFQIGNLRPFGTSSITYSVKLKTTVIIGSSNCHRASVYPRCNLFAHHSQDSSVITMSMICRPNDTIEVQLKNIGTKNQSNWGIVKSYEDIIILYQDTFKLNVGNSRIFKYKLDTNKVYTAEVFNNNGDPINPILIRHDDQCTNKKPIIFNNPALQFNRHDEAREYEEDCDIVRGSYDPNIKSVIPVGLFSEHYTSTGTELKYSIDFQNTGTDTAFRVVLVDTLSSDLNIASFVPGVSSHPYSIEFGGRAVKFIFDPIKLVDLFHNEPLSHGFVCFKINHVSSISPKTKIENKADIYFDYNTAVRTNTVFNTIFDTIQIYVPKGGGGTGSILGQNQMITDIYPNPASEKVFISMSESVKELSIEMIDMSGRLVQKQISKNEKTVELNVSNLQKGIYILRCMSGDKLVVVKKVEIK